MHVRNEAGVTIQQANIMTTFKYASAVDVMHKLWEIAFRWLLNVNTVLAYKCALLPELIGSLI